MHQTFVLGCESSSRDEEVIRMVNVHCPRTFSLDNCAQNPGLVVGKEIMFLSQNECGHKVSSFDGESWKELKKITQI